MGKFSLTIKFNEHSHARRAHRQKIEHALAQVAQAVGAGESTSGDIVDAGGGAEPQRVVGRWNMED